MRSRAGTHLALMILSLASSVACGRPAVSHAPGAEHGIEVLGVELMADGDLARLNYRVIDYEKAKLGLHGTIRLYATETDLPLEVTSVGRLGAMRQRPSRSGMRQFIMFTNSGRLLRRGGTAVLAIDGRRIPGIPVS